MNGLLENDKQIVDPVVETPTDKPTMALAPANFSAETLIARAIDRGVNVDVMERLLAIRRELKAETAKEAFDRALAAFQSECPTIAKTKRVMNKGGSGVRYSYAPLEAIVHQVKELLQRHGFSYTLDAQVEAGWVTATCCATHAQGHSKTSQFKVPVDKEAFMNEAQKFASALTFAKRYAFCNAFGILTGDDDDDSVASGEPRQHAAPPPRPASAPSPHPAPAPAPAAAPEPKHATDATRKWMIEQLRATPGADARPIVTSYFQAVSQLLPTEPLEDLPFRWVPVNKEQLHELAKRIAEFEQGEEAKPAFDANPEPLPTRTTPAAKPPAGDWNPAWKAMIVPFGKDKDSKFSELDGKALWWWFMVWAAKPLEPFYSERTQKTYPPKATDVALWNALNENRQAAIEHYGFKPAQN